MIPLVLIPGMMCDARMWGDLPAQLGQITHILPTQSDTVQTLAAQVLQDAPPRFALAGLSMGGIIAMEALHQAPQRITHLALFDTNPLAELPEVQANRARQIARAQTDLVGVLRDEMKPNYLHPGPDRAVILDLCMDMALSLGPEVFGRQSRALANRPDQTQTLAAFKGPALVLMGEHDKLCPRDRHDQMHALMPHSRLAVIPNAGHLPTLEQPAQTYAELVNWLSLPERTAS